MTLGNTSKGLGVSCPEQVLSVYCAVAPALNARFRQVEDQKEDMSSLQDRQRDLFETIKSLEKDIQV